LDYFIITIGITGYCKANNIPMVSYERIYQYGKNSKELSKLLIEMLLPYKRNIYTITTDNGTEFADHEIIAKN
jgi:IS30 family transposase